MGSAVGAALRNRGETVLWASAGRSAATTERAERARLEDAGTIEELARRCNLILSLCPPHAAVGVARPLARFPGIYVDANAISPATSRTVAALVGRYVDGGIIGPPPRTPGTTRLYLSGDEANTVTTLFADTLIDARVVSDQVGAASALKMAYAAWTKGSAALLLAARALARSEGIEQTLLDEWRSSLPQLEQQSVAASRSAVSKGWRWIGEMNEIAETFARAGLPDGFHRAAAEVYRRSPRGVADGDELVEHVLAALAGAANTGREPVKGHRNPPEPQA
jgi:3-hydroxyisobutyrate dehydrogenase-like beta-hydroxyacid dehydrogenase